MALMSIAQARIRGISTCVPHKMVDNLSLDAGFSNDEVQKIVRMAGVRTRYVADDSVCSSDLCEMAAKDIMSKLGWSQDSINALVMVTQSPDYFLPSTACILQHKLGLPTSCLAFDMGLGCSGYTYGLMVAASMLQGKGLKRILLLHGETPTRFGHPSDRSVALLFGDAGSATAIEVDDKQQGKEWYFNLYTDGGGYQDLIIRGGGFRNRVPEDPMDHYLHMDGANIFNFTIKRIPQLIKDTLEGTGKNIDQIDYVVLHQSNKFIMKHLNKKIGVPPEKMPFTISEFGSAGGPSVPLTITRGNLIRPADRPISMLLVAYGVGLSWGTALVDLPPEALLSHIQLKE